ncbi:helix-turn-helix domain-containing protein [Limnoglobus roseus]|uniref:DNA-binding protein n=1 Tax=Limnoglobus roseus TaxID=2598579 RepID=A0A5C1AIL9_9BACT|nr:helix-turn-helix domain-containing protein [Limnoglobus roseus]QEL19279.1 DNA-binding protein [Limnoglobus roseus]
MSAQTPSMMSIKQAAFYCCVCPNLVRDWVKTGRLAHYRIGAAGKRGKILVLKDDLDQLLASFRVSTPVTQPAVPRASKPVSPHVKLKHLKID